MKLRIDYFKQSGKWYHRVDREFPELPIWDILKMLREMNREGRLPGLASGTWAGPMVVTEVEFELPHLVLPNNDPDEDFIYVEDMSCNFHHIKATFTAMAEMLRTDVDKLLISTHAVNMLKVAAPSGTYILVSLDNFKRVHG